MVFILVSIFFAMEICESIEELVVILDTSFKTMSDISQFVVNVII